MAKFALGDVVKVEGLKTVGKVTHIKHPVGSDDVVRYKVDGKYWNEGSLTKDRRSRLHAALDRAMDAQLPVGDALSKGSKVSVKMPSGPDEQATVTGPAGKGWWKVKFDDGSRMEVAEHALTGPKGSELHKAEDRAVRLHRALDKVMDRKAAKDVRPRGNEKPGEINYVAPKDMPEFERIYKAFDKLAEDRRTCVGKYRATGESRAGAKEYDKCMANLNERERTLNVALRKVQPRQGW